MTVSHWMRREAVLQRYDLEAKTRNQLTPPEGDLQQITMILLGTQRK